MAVDAVALGHMLVGRARIKLAGLCRAVLGAAGSGDLPRSDHPARARLDTRSQLACCEGFEK